MKNRNGKVNEALNIAFIIPISEERTVMTVNHINFVLNLSPYLRKDLLNNL